MKSIKSVRWSRLPYSSTNGGIVTLIGLFAGVVGVVGAITDRAAMFIPATAVLILLELWAIVMIIIGCCTYKSTK